MPAKTETSSLIITLDHETGKVTHVVETADVKSTSAQACFIAARLLLSELAKTDRNIPQDPSHN